MADKHKMPTSSLGKTHFTSSGKLTFDLTDPVLKSALANLPDEHRALAIENFQQKATTPKSGEVLEELQEYKSALSNEQRIKLLKHRFRDPHEREVKIASTIPHVSALATVPKVAKTSAVGDGDDPTRLTTSVKTPTGTFDDVSPATGPS